MILLGYHSFWVILAVASEVHAQMVLNQPVHSTHSNGLHTHDRPLRTNNDYMRVNTGYMRTHQCETNPAICVLVEVVKVTMCLIDAVLRQTRYRGLFDDLC